MSLNRADDEFEAKQLSLLDLNIHITVITQWVQGTLEQHHSPRYFVEDMTEWKCTCPA